MRRAIPLYVLDSDGVGRFARQQAQSNLPMQTDITPDTVRVLDQPEDCKAAEGARPTRRACHRR
jgi:hypothetical protein